jgi:hypothetical protein
MKNSCSDIIMTFSRLRDMEGSKMKFSILYFAINLLLLFLVCHVSAVLFLTLHVCVSRPVTVTDHALSPPPTPFSSVEVLDMKVSA